MKWFSDPQPTRQQAEALHQPKPLDFEPAAVFETPQGFVMGLLHPDVDWPPVEVAQQINELLSYTMVSHCDPLLGIWAEARAWRGDR